MSSRSEDDNNKLLEELDKFAEGILVWMKERKMEGVKESEKKVEGTELIVSPNDSGMKRVKKIKLKPPPLTVKGNRTITFEFKPMKLETNCKPSNKDSEQD